MTLTGNGMAINYNNQIIDSNTLFHFQSNTNYHISTTFTKAIKGTLTKDDINELEACSKKMDKIVAQIDHQEFMDGNSTRQIVRKLESIIAKHS